MLEVFLLQKCDVVSFMYACAWNYMSVANHGLRKKPWQKNGEIAAFNAVFVRIKYKSNMAARYVDVIDTTAPYVYTRGLWLTMCYFFCVFVCGPAIRNSLPPVRYIAN